MNFKDKKIIIFDMDGTLIDSIGIWNKVDTLTIEFYTGKHISEEEVNLLRDNILTNTKEIDIYRAYIKELIKRYDIKVDLEEVYSKRKWYGSEIPKKEVKFKPFAKEVLLKFKELGYKLALATTSTLEKVKIYSYENENTKGIDFFEIFDVILTKDDVIKKKPDPEVLNKILNYFDESPENAIVFEDSYQGILAAKNANIEVIAVYDKYSDYEREKIELLADYNIKSFKEILDII